jgi:hypothetical protein
MTEPEPLKQLVTEQQLANILSVSARHIRVLRTRKLIPWIRLGRSVRFYIPDVETAIRQSLTVHARVIAKGGL